MLEAWLSGFESLLHVQELLFLTVGMGVGLIAGAVPGLGPTTALALLIPLTYGMQPISALALSAGVMGAAPMGGSIAAILLNAPGAAPNAATCLDGYPLAQQGKAGLAIGAAASANSIGGIIGTFSLLLVLPVAKSLVLLFGPPEFFLLAILGLVVVASASRGKMLRGLVTGVFGLMVASVGYNKVTGVVRYTFGVDYLWDGIHLVPSLIGLFAVAEMINLWVKGGAIAKDPKNVKITRLMAGLFETFRHWPTVLRGSLIGTVVGAVPGAGGVVAAFLSYSITVQMSNEPETFGKGNIQGVIAPEAAINAKDSSTLIPTLAFGIPGSAEMAVFLGILVLHGLQPGPLLLISESNTNLRVDLGFDCGLHHRLLHRTVSRPTAGTVDSIAVHHPCSIGADDRADRKLGGRPDDRERDRDAGFRNHRASNGAVGLSSAAHCHLAGLGQRPRA